MNSCTAIWPMSVSSIDCSPTQTDQQAETHRRIEDDTGAARWTFDADEFRPAPPSKRRQPNDRRLTMSKVAAKLNLTQVGRVCVTIADTDRAIDFYVDTLGFEKVVDAPMGPDMRWVEVAVAGTPTTIALAPPPQGQEAGGSQTGICLDSSHCHA